MITAFILFSASLFHRGQCNDISSIEVDRLELSPFYNAIIFSDIAEIINEMDMNFKPDMQANSASESDDDEVQNLLLEYQHYLDKAQRQRANYLEKSKGKNKVPLLRHEKCSKLNVPKIHSFDTIRNYMVDNIQPQQKMFYNNPYDLFIPMSLAPEQSLPTFNKIIWNEHKMRDFSVPKLKSDNGVLSSCYCEDNKFPCKCKCKQCLIPLERPHTTFFEPSKMLKENKPLISNSYKNIGYSNEYNMDDSTNHNLNVRIKVDIQMPKIDNALNMHKNLHAYKNAQLEDVNVTEANTSTNLSFPSLNFPIPLNIFTAGLSKLYQYGYSPIHKISLHKKKKAHWGNPSKKSRSKFLSSRHTKGNSYEATTKSEEYEKHDQIFNKTPQWNQLKITSNLTEPLGANSTTNIISDVRKQNNTFANIPIFINISSDESSIETETTSKGNINNTTWGANKTTEAPQIMRIKRENTSKHKIVENNSDPSSNVYSLTVKGLNTSNHNSYSAKKIENNDQQGLMDIELLYWPKKDEKKLKNVVWAAKNLQLRHDILNVSDTTFVTEKMFNKMNWDNMDTVASTFATVVGKYANGIITFCSNTLCRSLKCADKNCLHRSCTPEERFRQIGHCQEVSNDTEPIFSKDVSAITSPNVAYEFIDALQKNMMGQIFGKATICLNVKCITFEAVNKYFSKHKCLKKELNSSGHCKTVKNVKNI